MGDNNVKNKIESYHDIYQKLNLSDDFLFSKVMQGLKKAHYRKSTISLKAYSAKVQLQIKTSARSLGALRNL